MVPGGGKAGGWGGPGQGIQIEFVEAQQIDFGCSRPWEGWRLGRHPGRESKINLLRLNKLILVVPCGGKAGGWGGTQNNRLRGLSKPELSEINDPTRPVKLTELGCDLTRPGLISICQNIIISPVTYTKETHYASLECCSLS